MPAIAFRVTGTVQGVAFRKYTQRFATKKGLVGHVQNEPDGSVVGTAEGTSEQIEALIAYLHKGSPKAVVKEVTTTPIEPLNLTTFEIRK
ncbi:Acylphosphatase [Giardia muris]|uniref:acylphosphatase n=1 Tax=Giardia muris TaxID=5742 RepID=A0A4Z1STJ3_GIAMU|nr:Acylphosphatase [Giardia muris]|eukprot:TNJ26958.1 Acylphosphatase [Giardia muris]